ncbi:hypothetical protein FB45DRAFT_937911 [Roridomyces roridus]|uniref:Large ribosomal subunit protein uL4 C-terminal domain-containing protein n=1 Tax=Roridomyces roridus TaxID=1738132 RepID=A0AAD7FDN9_9AGAR|nr:hypothetical protein FB45DRAFT_937911 [Roridomyces roridus]
MASHPTLNVRGASRVASRPISVVSTQKKNPLVNKAALFHLNPYAKTLRRQEFLKQERIKKEKQGQAGEAFLANLFAP